jgi:hypothetical protein
VHVEVKIRVAAHEQGEQILAASLEEFWNSKFIIT